MHAADESGPLTALGSDLSRAGYPVSLQLSRVVARELEASSISIHQCRSGGQESRLGPALPTWIHLPKRPLLPGFRDRSAIFAIPKSPLKPMTRYLVVVALEIGAEKEEIRWRFTTGRRARDHADLGK